MRSSDVTEAVARQWVDAWTAGDLPAVRAILADGATIEDNLGLPAERMALLDAVRTLAGSLDRAVILSLTTADRRAALLYDCQVRATDAAEPRSIRLAEFLDVVDERVAGIRRVYDLTAVDRLLPGLRAPAAS